jgi:tryptophan halogenase
MLMPDEETEVFGRTDYGYHLPALAYAGRAEEPGRRLGVELHQALASRRAGRETARSPPWIWRRPLRRGRPVRRRHRRRGRADDRPGRGPRKLARAFSGRPGAAARGPRFASSRPMPTSGPGRAAGSGCIQPGQTHVVQVYAGDLCTDDQALRWPPRRLGPALTDAVVSVSDPGRRAQAWDRNCVAVGEAACAFDPVHGVDLQAVQLGLVHLLSLFPVAGDFAPSARPTTTPMREVRAPARLPAAHYVVNRYAQSPFWERARAAAASDAWPTRSPCSRRGARSRRSSTRPSSPTAGGPCSAATA